jgi:hypothetical protein
MFEEPLIEQLLCHCCRWPEPKSILIMANTSFHHTDRTKELCSNSGVKLLYLPPYFPDLNPIEEFFAELKAFLRRNWQNTQIKISEISLNGAWMSWGLGEKVQNVIFERQILRLKSNEN